MRRVLMTMGVAVLCSAAGMQAQYATPSKDKMDDKAMKSGTVMVTGCVADKDGSGHYMLTNAMKAGTMMDKDAPATGTTGATPMSYTLSGGGDLKAHVGHKIEVTGTVEHGKMGKMGKMADKDKMDHDKMMSETLKVKSVKMISASCQ